MKYPIKDNSCSFLCTCSTRQLGKTKIKAINLKVKQGQELLFCFNQKFVGNKAKGRMSKWVFQENKERQIFQKTNISYPSSETLVLRFALLPYYRRIV